jgi:hypothetical protein
MKQFHCCKFVEKRARGFTGARINRPLFFSWVQCFFCFFFHHLYQNFGEIQPKKKKKKSQIYTRRTNSKILPISVSKDSEISPEKKTLVGCSIFCFLDFII